MIRRRSTSTAIHRRRGSMVPAIAMSLLVVGSAMALVFDRLWQDAAFLELRSAGEAAALAAANRLAGDDTLAKDPDWEVINQAARTAASEIAARNLVGGHPVKVWDNEEGDVEIGREIQDNSGQKVFVKATDQPDCVSVTVEQGRGTSNPVGLLVRDLSGAGRLLRTTVRAKADHHVAGIRPFQGANSPILPIAISAMGPTGWDASTAAGPNEMTVWSAPSSASDREQLLATLHVIDIGNGLSGDTLAQQCREGWSGEDLRKHGGELWVDGKSLTLKSTPKIPGGVAAELQALVGQSRMCLVYEAVLPGTSSGEWNLSCRRLVAVRVLGVQQGADGMVVLKLQPAVVVTRTAIIAEDADELWNPYVCKVEVTN